MPVVVLIGGETGKISRTFVAAEHNIFPHGTGSGGLILHLPLLGMRYGHPVEGGAVTGNVCGAEIGGVPTRITRLLVACTVAVIILAVATHLYS